ncbi:flagellar biosynthesis anti-sigma factor FlgM [Treponema parvum]|uniref:Flagellar biosynthesis anti-sigma factor FlgM n=1 Tax=Treponema parvum TaxID=138851 RepID=A0A975F238_9SPIR|nr:flagellar biosynthesis anti-sigma factor FlgM [Treponema parvum]QTQ13007.1 flagellar biosynthesis anti-sigma factor FlgM [Treponema parvum]
MMIDKIGGVNSLNNLQNTKRTDETSRYDAGSDSIFVSEEAQKMAESFYLKEVADATPDVRADLVAEIKQKIKDPSYLNADTIGSAADRILSSFGL